MFKNKTLTISLFGGLALALIFGGASLFGFIPVANAVEMTAEEVQSIARSSTGPGPLGEGPLTHGGWGRGGLGGTVDYQQLLADALGITVEELQSACEAARTAALERAVAEGSITREQADEMAVWGGPGHKGFGFRGFGRGPMGIAGSTIDEAALLAEALDVTVEELQAAREQANLAAIEQAVAEGIMTQEQADEMQAHRNLQAYLDRDTLLAEALGMTVEELQAAHADGKTLTTLMGERDLDAATVRENLAAARDEAIAQAVADGVITQEQADDLKDGPGFGMVGPCGPGMRGKRHGPGDFEGRFPGHPDREDFSGIEFHRPGRAIQADSDL